MRKIISAKTHALLSLGQEEVIPLSNCLNEVLSNSSISEEDCGTRIGVDIGELRRLQNDLRGVIESAGSDPFEIFEAEKDGYSLQLRAVSAMGSPADLSYESALGKIQDLANHQE